MLIQAVIILFALFVISRVISRYRVGDITGLELGIWLFFWLLVAAATFAPQRTDFVAQLVGVERGADLLVYLSVVTLFFILFKVLVSLEKIDRDITTIVRQTALKKKDNNNG